MMKKLEIVLLITSLLTYFACGNDAVRFQLDAKKDALNTLDYKVTKCGLLQKLSGLSSHQNGFYLTENSNTRYELLPMNDEVRNALSKLGSAQGCVYSNDNPTQGFEGEVLNVYHITFN